MSRRDRWLAVRRGLPVPWSSAATRSRACQPLEDGRVVVTGMVGMVVFTLVAAALMQAAAAADGRLRITPRASGVTTNSVGDLEVPYLLTRPPPFPNVATSARYPCSK